MKLEAKVVRRTGCSTSDRVLFEMESDFTPSPALVSAMQERLGYHPAGYDGPWHIKTTGGAVPHTWLTTWDCSASCD